MSELINNREHKQEVLKQLIHQLHEGVSQDEVKAKFIAEFGEISVQEISSLEHALVRDGLAVEEIQRLCDVHADVFKGSIAEIHSQDTGFDADAGHPIDTLKRENRMVEELIDEKVGPLFSAYQTTKLPVVRKQLSIHLELLATIDRHYNRKEMLIFPMMEKHGITTPPQVMWGVDDEIRGHIKTLTNMIENKEKDKHILKEQYDKTIQSIHDMIFKEEHILIPLLVETLTHDEWKQIETESQELGFTLLEDVPRWVRRFFPTREEKKVSEKKKIQEENGVQNDARIPMDMGSLSPTEINAILNTVPFDMTFVGADDTVKYFTNGKERIFERAKSIIGREVKNCHPPKSVHIVEQIVEELRSGVKDQEDFWINFGGTFVHIRYYAVRDKEGTFLGVLEVTQDIKPIRDLEGEKRLVSSPSEL
ncbi:MAG: DUF438 domain-containing protein [Culicoidibacterales bacterium]